MKFTELSIPGVFRIDVEPFIDFRGEFSRTFCSEEFSQHGLSATMCQSSISGNRRQGTLRGMHFRPESDGEAKLVRCTRGSAFDVIIDLRRSSPTYCNWTSLELSAAELNAVYIPPGCAHGFISLVDDTELLYMMSVPFIAGSEQGVRWDDPAFNITWPIMPILLSDRDKNFAPFVLNRV